MRRAVRGLGVAFILLSLIVARSAAADAEKARAHYERGRSYFQVGEYRKALEEFKAAHVEKNDPAYIYNIAECHRQLGEAKDAVIFYRRFVRMAPPGHALRPDAERRIAELEAPAPAGTGQPAPPPVSPVNQAAPAPPEPEVVVATPVAPGTPAPVDVAPDRTSGGGSRRTAAYVVGGASVVALGIGVYFGLDARSKWNESEPLCPADKCNARGYSLSQDAGTSALVADIAIGAGLVGAGLATYLWVTSRHETSPLRAAAWRVRLRPEIVPARWAGLAVGTAW
jgi:hypothetical protein